MPYQCTKISNQHKSIKQVTPSSIHPTPELLGLSPESTNQQIKLLNEQYIIKSENRVWKILTALYGIFRKLAALQTAVKKQRNSENSLWPWVVKYPLLNRDKPGLGIDREWSKDDYEAIGSGGWP